MEVTWTQYYVLIKIETLNGSYKKCSRTHMLSEVALIDSEVQLTINLDYQKV